MDVEEVVIFAWLPCTWVDELEMLAETLERAWGVAIYGVLEMRRRGSGPDVSQSKRDAPIRGEGTFYFLKLIQWIGSKNRGGHNNEKLMKTKHQGSKLKYLQIRLHFPGHQWALWLGGKKTFQMRLWTFS